MVPTEHNIRDDIDFLGEFEFTLDPQRRLAIPSEWHSSTPGQDCYFVFPGLARSLVLMSSFLYGKIRDGIGKVSFADPAYPKVADIARLGKKCVCDKAGRVSLSQALLDYAELQTKQKVLLIGAFASARILNPVIWGQAEHWSPDECLAAMREIHDKPDAAGEALRKAINGPTGS